jgi:hypothetical protein
MYIKTEYLTRIDGGGRARALEMIFTKLIAGLGSLSEFALNTMVEELTLRVPRIRDHASPSRWTGGWPGPALSSTCIMSAKEYYFAIESLTLSPRTSCRAASDTLNLSARITAADM